MFGGTGAARLNRVWAGGRGAVRAIYRSPGGEAGCCLHIVVDDLDTSDSAVGICAQEATERKHVVCHMVASFLGRLTRVQRRAFLRPLRRSR